MKPRTSLLLSALVYVGCTLAGSGLARIPTDAAQAAAAVLIAGGLLATAALIPTRAYSRRALLGAGAILAACTALPLAFVSEPSAWLRASPVSLGYFWLWLMLLGMPLNRGRAWCGSTLTVLIASTILGAGLVASALW